MSPISVSHPDVVNNALSAINRALKDHWAVIDALEEAQDTFSPERALPVRCEWGAAIVSRRVTSLDTWVCDIVAGHEGPPGIVWPLPPSIPPGACLLELVTGESGERVLLTPRVIEQLGIAGAKLLGITPIIWDDADLDSIGRDDPIPSVDFTLIPQPIHGDRTPPIPQMRATLCASAMPAPYVLLAVQRPPGLPR